MNRSVRRGEKASRSWPPLFATIARTTTGGLRISGWLHVFRYRSDRGRGASRDRGERGGPRDVLGPASRRDRLTWRGGGNRRRSRWRAGDIQRWPDPNPRAANTGDRVRDAGARISARAAPPLRPLSCVPRHARARGRSCRIRRFARSRSRCTCGSARLHPPLSRRPREPCRVAAADSEHRDLDPGGAGSDVAGRSRGGGARPPPHRLSEITGSCYPCGTQFLCKPLDQDSQYE